MVSSACLLCRHRIVAGKSRLSCKDRRRWSTRRARFRFSPSASGAQSFGSSGSTYSVRLTFCCSSPWVLEQESQKRRHYPLSSSQFDSTVHQTQSGQRLLLPPNSDVEAWTCDFPAAEISIAVGVTVLVSVRRVSDSSWFPSRAV